MIILDTNVVSALMQQQADPQVIAWLDSQAAESIWINSVTLFEGRYGLALLPDGKRKALLVGIPVDREQSFRRIVNTDSGLS